MSIARIKTVQKAQKDQGKCDKCGAELLKGEPYRWFKLGFRSRVKRVRCLNSKCTPRTSELESTSKSEIYAAFEAYYDDPVDAESEEWLEDLKSSLEEIKGAFENYKDEKQSALDGWPNGNSQLEEALETAETAFEQVENVDPDEDTDDPQAEIDRCIEEADAAQENL